MSVKSEESDKKFRDWKEELLRRCEEHVKNHPEEKPRVPTSRGFVLPSTLNTLVLVNQDTTIKDCWQVYVNGDLVFMNQGPFAQRDALRFAMRAACNPTSGFMGNDQAVSSLPPMCIFCGNRYSHRTDCPDQRKLGPDLTGQAG